MNTTFLKWWILFTAQLCGVWAAWNYGVFNTLYEVDKSFIGFGILIVHSIATLWIGNKTKNIQSTNFDTSQGYFICETFLKMGMVGTVIGFILAFSNFTELDVTNIESMRLVLRTMATGIGTALWTTLIGFVCNTLLKLQLINYENDPTDGGWIT